MIPRRRSVVRVDPPQSRATISRSGAPIHWRTRDGPRRGRRIVRWLKSANLQYINHQTASHPPPFYPLQYSILIQNANLSGAQNHTIKKSINYMTSNCVHKVKLIINFELHTSGIIPWNPIALFIYYPRELDAPVVFIRRMLWCWEPPLMLSHNVCVRCVRSVQLGASQRVIYRLLKHRLAPLRTSYFCFVWGYIQLLWFFLNLGKFQTPQCCESPREILNRGSWDPP